MANIAQQLEDALKALQASDEAIKGHAAMVEACKVELAALAKERDQLKAAMEAMNVKHEAAMKDAEARLSAELASHTETKRMLEEAKGLLSNPAIGAVVGDVEAVPEGGQQSGNLSKESARAEYVRIKDPVEAAIYRRDHKAELGL